MTSPTKPEAEFDYVAEAIATAPLDDAPLTDEDIRIMKERRADPQWVDGAVVTAELRERARRERGLPPK